MGGVALFLGFEACGVVIARRFLPRAGRLTRAWLGLTLGQVLMMWLPSLFAFLIRFTALAQGLALVAAAGCAALCLFLRPKGETIARARREAPGWLVVALVAPLAIIMAYLQYTHVLLPGDGGLWTGQSTYGDLNFHMGISNGLLDAAYPPEYVILSGSRLGYPFLADALSASMMSWGTPSRWAFIIPGVFQTILAGWGFVMLAFELTGGKRATALAFVLLFLNGGLGFAYMSDMVVADSSAVYDALYGFYRAPANLIDHNIYWANLIVDMMLPQRTFLAGMMIFLPAVYLLRRARITGETRDFALLGVWAGAMPMIHTHSFMALGIISAGSLLYNIRGGWKLIRGYLLYALIAVCMAAPQLLLWTLPQSNGWIQFHFDWVNNTVSGMTDDWLWFWFKNVGPVLLFFLPGYFLAPKRYRHLLVGAGLVFVAADLFVFQKNHYDNNKLFYAAFMVALPAAAAYLVSLYDRMKGLPGRSLLAGLFIAVSVFSGAFSIAREGISEYMLYPDAEVAAADYARENTPVGSVFLTGDEHNNAISSLAGRSLMCGAPNFLSTHGLAYEQAHADAYLLYENPEANLSLFTAYGIDYIYVNDHARAQFNVDTDALDRLFTKIYDQDGVILYDAKLPAS